ncbi:MAG: hypothetical protein GXO66_02330 [Euryarchaeota archaeon]|nr:hypothetical protein [Euryarchaeota archaeon]
MASGTPATGNVAGVALILLIAAVQAPVWAAPAGTAEEALLAEKIESANNEFRKNVMKVLNAVAGEQGLAGVEDFIMVSPWTVGYSPVALLGGVAELPLEELERGRDIVLADFCIPPGSEIPSGTYIMRVKKVGGEWVAELRDLEGRTVLQKRAIVEYGPFDRRLPGRGYDIYSSNAGVRFGAQLREAAFYMDVKLGSGEVAADRCTPEITEELARFRSRVDSAFGSRFKTSGDLLIVTRGDALLIAGVSGNEVVTYLRAPGIAGGIYRASPATGKLAGAAGGELTGEVRDMSAYSKLDAGLIGGILGERLILGYVGQELSSFKVVLPIKKAPELAAMQALPAPAGSAEEAEIEGAGTEAREETAKPAYESAERESGVCGPTAVALLAALPLAVRRLRPGG